MLVDGVRVGPTTPNTRAFPPVTSDHAISVEFALQRHTIVSSAGPHGTMSPARTVNLPYGGAQSYAIRPDPGYHVAEVRVDSRSAGVVTTLTFTNLTSDHTIGAAFAPGPFSPPRRRGEAGPPASGQETRDRDR